MRRVLGACLVLVPLLMWSLSADRPDAIPRNLAPIDARAAAAIPRNPAPIDGSAKAAAAIPKNSKESIGSSNQNTGALQQPTGNLAVKTTQTKGALSPSKSQLSTLNNNRIVGGTFGPIESLPYQCCLLKSNYCICGASIIAPLWVITAAHCLHKAKINTISLRAGSSNRETGGVIFYPSKLIIHGLYNTVTTDYDIALIQVSTSFKFGPTIAAIALCLVGLIPAGELVTISGFGTTSQSGTASKTLQVAQVPIVGPASCRQIFGETAITDRMMCAGYPEGGKDTCQGDSGGPMAWKGCLCGITSWGYGCAQPNSPGIYTNVSWFLPWIKKYTGII